MFELIMVIALMGLFTWTITTYVPMPEPYRKAIYIVSTVILIFFIARAFGISSLPLHLR